MELKKIKPTVTIESPTFGDLREMAKEVERYAKHHGDTLSSAFTSTTFYCLALLSCTMDSIKDRFIFGEKEIS